MTCNSILAFLLIKRALTVLVNVTTCKMLSLAFLLIFWSVNGRAESNTYQCCPMQQCRCFRDLIDCADQTLINIPVISVSCSARYKFLSLRSNHLVCPNLTILHQLPNITDVDLYDNPMMNCSCISSTYSFALRSECATIITVVTTPAKTTRPPVKVSTSKMITHNDYTITQSMNLTTELPKLMTTSTQNTSTAIHRIKSSLSNKLIIQWVLQTSIPVIVLFIVIWIIICVYKKKRRAVQTSIQMQRLYRSHSPPSSDSDEEVIYLAVGQATTTV